MDLLEQNEPTVLIDRIDIEKMLLEQIEDTQSIQSTVLPPQDISKRKKKNPTFTYSQVLTTPLPHFSN